MVLGILKFSAVLIVAAIVKVLSLFGFQSLSDRYFAFIMDREVFGDTDTVIRPHKKKIMALLHQRASSLELQEEDETEMQCVGKGKPMTNDLIQHQTSLEQQRNDETEIQCGVRRRPRTNDIVQQLTSLTEQKKQDGIQYSDVQKRSKMNDIIQEQTSSTEQEQLHRTDTLKQADARRTIDNDDIVSQNELSEEQQMQDQAETMQHDVQRSSRTTEGPSNIEQEIQDEHKEEETFESQRTTDEPLNAEQETIEKTPNIEQDIKNKPDTSESSQTQVSTDVPSNTEQETIEETSNLEQQIQNNPESVETFESQITTEEPSNTTKNIPDEPELENTIPKTISSPQTKKHLKVLEIGAAQGVNLRYYPPGTHLTVVEPNVFFLDKLKENLKLYPQVELDRFLSSGAEDMHQVEDESMDAVVSTYVLCSVSDCAKVMKEVLRVLAPGGVFLFVEHVPYPKGQTGHVLQTLLNSFWPSLLQGCQLIHNAKESVDQAGFNSVNYKTVNIDELYHFLKPHVVGYAIK